MLTENGVLAQSPNQTILNTISHIEALDRQKNLKDRISDYRLAKTTRIRSKAGAKISSKQIIAAKGKIKQIAAHSSHSTRYELKSSTDFGDATNMANQSKINHLRSHKRYNNYPLSSFTGSTLHTKQAHDAKQVSKSPVAQKRDMKTEKS